MKTKFVLAGSVLAVLVLIVMVLNLRPEAGQAVSIAEIPGFPGGFSLPPSLVGVQVEWYRHSRARDPLIFAGKMPSSELAVYSNSPDCARWPVFCQRQRLTSFVRNGELIDLPLEGERLQELFLCHDTDRLQIRLRISLDSGLFTGVVSRP